MASDLEPTELIDYLDAHPALVARIDDNLGWSDTATVVSRLGSIQSNRALVLQAIMESEEAGIPEEEIVAFIESLGWDPATLSWQKLMSGTDLVWPLAYEWD
jgi:hypothetical protein